MPLGARDAGAHVYHRRPADGQSSQGRCSLRSRKNHRVLMITMLSTGIFGDRDGARALV